MKKIIRAMSLALIMAATLAMNTFAIAPVATGATKMPPWIIIVFVAAVVIVVLALLPKFRNK